MTMKMNDDPFNFGNLKFPESSKRKLEDFLNDRISMARPRENQSVYFMGGKITLDHGDIPTRVLDSPMSNSYMIECIVYGGSKQTMTAVSEQTDTYNVVTIEIPLDFNKIDDYEVYYESHTPDDKKVLTFYLLRDDKVDYIKFTNGVMSIKCSRNSKENRKKVIEIS